MRELLLRVILLSRLVLTLKRLMVPTLPYSHPPVSNWITMLTPPGSSCHVAAANMRGTKAYGGTSDFEGMMVSIQDFSGDEAEFPTMPDEGTAWDATEWMVLGDPGAAVPAS